MSRTLSAIALTLALLTGVLLGHLTTAMSSVVTPAATGSEGRIAWVRAFYDGMNDYLATGDDGFLRLLSPEFQEPSAVDSTQGSTATLLDRLGALRRSASPPRFTIEEIHDLGTLVEVRLSTNVPSPLDIAGLTAEQPAAPAALEFVQLERNAIVARWSQDDRIPRIEQSTDALVPLRPNSELSLEISRVTLEPGAELVLPLDGASWIVVEQGAVTIDGQTSSQRITQGDMHIAMPDGPMRIANLETSPSAFWIAALQATAAHPESSYALADSIPPAGVTIDRRAWVTNFGAATVTSQLRTRIALVTLPAGTRVLAHEPEVGEVIAVIDGELETTVDRGFALRCLPTDLAITIQGSEPVATGEGVASRGGSALSYRVSSATPATLLILTAVSTESGAPGGSA